MSCSYRTAEAQQEAYDSGHSNAKPGQSPHDYLPALGLDWFRLTLSGGASFDRTWYRDVLGPAAAKSGLAWGGNFRSISDLPHVELRDWKSLVTVS